MFRSNSFFSSSVLLLALAFPGLVLAQGDAKQVAIDRYMGIISMRDLMEESFVAIAKNVPDDKRVEFLADMRAVINLAEIEQISKDGLAKTFTVDELNALSDFYTSPHGISGMRKFGAYLGEVMPGLNREIQRALKELQARHKK
jgi:hypothetical protein